MVYLNVVRQEMSPCATGTSGPSKDIVAPSPLSFPSSDQDPLRNVRTGQAFLTFRKSDYGRAGSVTSSSAAKFAITALTGFSINQTMAVILSNLIPHLDYRIVLAGPAILVAGVLFLISKFWSFTGRKVIGNKSGVD